MIWHKIMHNKRGQIYIYTMPWQMTLLVCLLFVCLFLYFAVCLFFFNYYLFVIHRCSCCAGRARSYSCWSCSCWPCSFCPYSCCPLLLLLVLLVPVLTGARAAGPRAHSPLPRRFLLVRAVCFLVSSSSLPRLFRVRA